MEYYSAVKRSELLTAAAAWTDHRDLARRERSQAPQSASIYLKFNGRHRSSTALTARTEAGPEDTTGASRNSLGRWKCSVPNLDDGYRSE